MILYLAGVLTAGNQKTVIKYIDENNLFSKINLLESFYYFDQRYSSVIKRFKRFILDSGAYTLAISKSGNLSDRDLLSYVESYTQFIIDNNIKNYFEMDLDNIKGWDWVKRTSLMLEKNTGVKPIPVWHPNRKKRGFEEMCERYPYISIGTTDIRKYLSRSLTWFTMTAHRYHSKIHGLGYTKISDLDRSGFDSVDSTSWIYANMTGTVYRFHRGMMDKIKAPAGKKVDIRANLCNSIYQWSKLSDYLEGK